MSRPYGDWEPVIGLEIHVQLSTRSKLFCGCRPSFGDPPNTHTCPVCLGLPGALPVLNAAALRQAVTAALALGCAVHPQSVFARKSYFYPDLPKGYQISQHDRPLATDGALTIGGEGGGRRVRVARLHLEEDAGKSRHGVGGGAVVDFNRAGTPLAEIVLAPELGSPAEARDALRRLHAALLFAGVTDGSLARGSFRCDANVSVRRRGQTELGARVELKNINSFRFVAEALAVETRRQVDLVARGERVVRQTRGYRPDRRETIRLRDKEGDEDYRYFPEPDLPPLTVAPVLVALLRAALPELAAVKRARFVSELGLSDQAAGVLTAHPRIAALFERATALGGEPFATASFMQTEVLRDAHTDGQEATLPLTPEQLATIVKLVASGKISGRQAKALYAEVRGTDRDPAERVAAQGMAVLSDEAALRTLADRVVADHPDQAQRYRDGRTGLLGFFVGQLMKATGGSADPRLAGALLRQALATPEHKR